MLRLNQLDKKWRDIIIGLSKSDLGGNGCLITSLCMILSKFYPERGFLNYFSPTEAAKNWEYVRTKYDSDPRYLVWNSINGSDMEFVWRKYGYFPKNYMTDPITKKIDTEFNILKKYSSHKDYGVVIQLITNSGQHWCALIGRAIFGWSGNDPYKGIRRWFLPFPYRYIRGFAIVKKTGS